jgi:hypothetical protein
MSKKQLGLDANVYGYFPMMTSNATKMACDFVRKLKLSKDNASADDAFIKTYPLGQLRFI